MESRRHGNDTIHANHMEMCRFRDEDDDGYEKFLGAFEKYLREIEKEREQKTDG